MDKFSDMFLTKFYADIAIVIKATESMKSILNEVKENAKCFCDKFHAEMEENGKHVEELRIKVIPFRDYKYDGEYAMADSGFFTLPAQNEEFVSYLDGIEAEGGGDGPGNALEALATAIQSDWSTQDGRHRHIIILYTDAGAVPLGDLERTTSPYYPANMPGSFEELTKRWNDESEEGGMPDERFKRLVIFAPDTHPWNEMLYWNKAYAFYSQAGIDLKETDFFFAYSTLVHAF